MSFALFWVMPRTVDSVPADAEVTMPTVVHVPAVRPRKVVGTVITVPKTVTETVAET